MSKLKICGIRRREDIEYINECLPDYIGFVFAEGSRRRVSRESAELLKKALDMRVISVGVFVNERAEEAAALCNAGVIDMAQLHGDEDAGYILKLKTLTKAPVIKAVLVGEGFNPTEAEASPADFLLFDSLTRERGGSGRAFDHSLLKGVKRPYFLAGGLNERNLPAALKELSPYCVDISSGAETDGVKDLEKIRALKYLL